MADSTNQSLFVDATNSYSDGHFPGHPIVPAAAQVEWIMKQLEAQQPQIRSWKIKQLKMIRELKPEREVNIRTGPHKQGWLGKVEDSDGPYAELFLVPHE
ncbi:MAG: hypothetical protein AAFX93_16950 [Verrucomicrobiota bacterium]